MPECSSTLSMKIHFATKNEYGNLHFTTSFFNTHSSHFSRFFLSCLNPPLSLFLASSISSSTIFNGAIVQRAMKWDFLDDDDGTIKKKKITWLNWHWCFLFFTLRFFSCSKISFIIFFSDIYIRISIDSHLYMCEVSWAHDDNEIVVMRRWI